MLKEEDVISFYKSYNLIPGINTTCSLLDFIAALTFAFEKDRSFGLFVRETLGPVDNNTFRLNFDSWEELFNCYCSFMVGYGGNKSRETLLRNK